MKRKANKRRTLSAVRPNAGIGAAYRRKLEALVDEMATSVAFWLKTVYRANEPEMAMDAGLVTVRGTSTPGGKRYVAVVDGEDLLGANGKPRLFKTQEAALKAGYKAPPSTASATSLGVRRQPLPAAELQRAIDDLVVRWQGKFDEASSDLARYFATSVTRRTDRALQAALDKSGITVNFRMTAATRDVVKATVEQNVTLIKSIPQQYLAGVQGDVMRSVQTGRDIGQLSRDLQEKYGVTRRRAAFIARDQNNKASSAIQKTRQIELGLDRGVWMHSTGGKTPRPRHVAADGVEFDLKKGLKVGDDGGWVMPGEEPNCFPESTRVEFANGVRKAYRHRYSGQLTEIVTDSGKTLRATPNHPVLTPHGWRAISALHEGDDVIEIADQRIQAIESKNDDHDAVALIGEIFQTLAKATFGHRVAVGGRHQFHGDGTDGDVDIVLAARALRIGRHLLRRQSGDSLDLSISNLLISSGGFIKSLARRHARTTALLVRGFGEALAAFDSFAFHANKVGLALTTGRATSIDDAPHDRSSIQAFFASQRKNASPAFVLPAQKTSVCETRRLFFDGHVFNLQTDDGWYAAEGIITHNCRCVWRAVIPGF